MPSEAPPNRSINRRTFVGLATAAAAIIPVAGCKRRGEPQESATSSAKAPNAAVSIVVNTHTMLGRFNRLSGVQGSPHPIVAEDIDHRGGFFSCGIGNARFPQDCPPNTLTLGGIFPAEQADPDQPESYHFAAIDEHMRAARGVKVQVLWQSSYDVGGSDRWVGMNLGGRAPTDRERWSRVVTRCLEHFNNGWADGLTYAVSAVEFPNEPNGLGGFGGRLSELIPAFLHFLRTIERYNQSHPTAVVAVGPGIPFSFDQWPEWEPKFRMLLTTLRKEGVALPVFSFHTYGTDVSPAANARVGIALRKLLDEHGMRQTDLWNTEWQAGDFLKQHLNVSERRASTASEQDRGLFGAGLATYALSCKIRWQGVVDRAYYYRANMRAFPPGFRDMSGHSGDWIGQFFTPKGRARPLALQEQLVSKLAEHASKRCQVSCPDDDAFVALGLRSEDRRQVAALLCNLHARPTPVSLRFDARDIGLGDIHALSIVANSPEILQRRAFPEPKRDEGSTTIEFVVPPLASIGVFAS